MEDKGLHDMSSHKGVDRAWEEPGVVSKSDRMRMVVDQVLIADPAPSHTNSESSSVECPLVDCSQGSAIVLEEVFLHLESAVALPPNLHLLTTS
jgi:hypothetical protein